MIHGTAIIDPGAMLDENVDVGPYSIIGEDVRIKSGTCIGPHVVINGPTTIGSDNRFFQFSSIGEIPQDLKFHGERSTLVIGDNNVVREFVTLQRGTEQGGGVTTIGDHNLIMAYVHIAHDCTVGSWTVFSNNATLAGHVRVDDYAVLGGFTAVHQFCRIGTHAFSGFSTAIDRDVAPYVTVAGNRAQSYGINTEGLKRHGFSSDTVCALKKTYRLLLKSKKTRAEALDEAQSIASESPEVKNFLDFITKSERGVVR